MNGSKRRIPLKLILAGLASTVVLGGCATDGYGYGGMSMGSGYYGGGPYYDPYYGPAGYYGGGYGGWYNDYYYPGRGYYVYDRRGSRHRWSDSQRAYWERRRENWKNGGGRDRADDRQWNGDRSGWNQNRRYDNPQRGNRSEGYTRRESGARSDGGYRGRSEGSSAGRGQRSFGDVARENRTGGRRR